MLVNFNEMLLKAKKEKYAVPHLNINDLEWAKYILEKCNELNIPVILGVSEGAAKYIGWISCCSWYGKRINGRFKYTNTSMSTCRSW